MREISLKNGKIALVDDCDFDVLNKFEWTAYKSNRSNRFYAVRFTYQYGKTFAHYMHREILGLAFGDKREGEHRSENGLDNQRHNLRIASSSQNKCNRGAHKNNRLGVKGVHIHADGKYRAMIHKDKKRYDLGLFNSLEEAADAYGAAAKALHGEFARVQ
jgi:hypothetical protein